VALEARTKFALGVVPGKRTLDSVRRLIGELAGRTDRQTAMFVSSDEYKPYRRVLLEVYGLSRPRRRRYRRGRRPHPRRVPPGGLVYATIHKHRRKGRVVRVTTHRIFGSAAELEQALAASPVSKKLNIAFVERYNGTDRHLNSRKGRKVYRFSKRPQLHQAMTFYAQAVYNFTRAHRGLEVQTADGARVRRTPAMAQGVADHVWSIKELCHRQACPPCD
jgi:IS1 family transposase